MTTMLYCAIGKKIVSCIYLTGIRRLGVVKGYLSFTVTSLLLPLAVYLARAGEVDL